MLISQKSFRSDRDLERSLNSFSFTDIKRKGIIVE